MKGGWSEPAMAERVSVHGAPVNPTGGLHVGGQHGEQAQDR